MEKSVGTYEVAVGVEVDIRRPDGTIETVRVKYNNKELGRITEREYQAYCQAVRAAGRGECLTYRNLTQTKSCDPSFLAEYTAAVAAERAYTNSHNAQLRMMAGGEECDQIGGAADIDRTPHHKGE